MFLISCGQRNIIFDPETPLSLYKIVDFPEGGTTIYLSNSNQKKMKTIEFKSIGNKSLLDILNKSVFKKHRQRKISQVDTAFEICQLETCSLWILTSADELINLTEKLESLLPSEKAAELRLLLEK